MKRPFPGSTALSVPLANDLFAPDLEEESTFDIREFLRIIRKRKWFILTMVTIITTAVVVWAFKQIPLYKATTTMQIDPPSLNLLNFKDVINDDLATSNTLNLQTQVRVLTSRTLARRVIEQLDLMQDPNLTGALAKKTAAAPAKARTDGDLALTPLFSDPSAAPTLSPAEQALMDRLIGQLIGNLQVGIVNQSRILQISYISPNAGLATKVANAYANAFIDYTLESRYNATQRASEWLMKQSEDLKAKLEKSEEQLGQYASDNGIVFLDTTPTNDKNSGGGQNTVMQQLSALNDELTKAQSDRIQIESLYKQVHSSSGVEITLFRESPLIKSLNEELAKLSQQYAEMSAKFQPGWPGMTQIRVQIDQVKEQIGEEKKRIIKTIDADYFSAINREDSFRQAFNQQKALANELNTKQIHYNILKREVDTNRQLYDGLLQRLKEASVSAGLKSSNIRILDEAEQPTVPFSPNKQRAIFLGFIVSVMSALGFAFMLEYMDRTVKTPDQVERFLRVPALAMVPALNSTRPRKFLGGRNGKGGADEKTHSIDLISFTNAKSVVSEAYRSLRTSILLSSNGHPPRTILVTSPGPGEGKSTTAINLGITLSQMGSKVLIVDADMRRPRIHKVFEPPEANPGFSAYLSGNSKLVPLIYETKVPNLYVIPAGATPPNPSELIGSEIMRQSLDLLAGHFNHVIIDSPPIMSVTDSTILSTLVEGVVLVVRGGLTNRDAATRTAQRLRDVGARIFGTVLNNVDIKSADYDYYYHQYYYYSYYSDEKKKDHPSNKGPIPSA